MILSPEKLIPVAKLEAYLLDPTPYQWGPLLAPFSPPLPREGQVILASFFGDVFVEDMDGGIWWVNGLEGRVDRAGINRDKFLERMGREHLTMLKTKLLEAMVVQDKLLPAGMLYGLKTPRSKGGKYSPDNIGTAPVVASMTYLGEQFRIGNAPAAPALQPTAADAKTKPNFWGKKK
ncbi:MAG: hypothetical protein Q8R02_01100 [Hyphomonadaceae bacterium]|nr:hypothetical protein [Hyphomonadaceae bacterium]